VAVEMNDWFATYGWRTQELQSVVTAVARELGIALEARYSLYRGDYYSWNGPGGAEILVQRNRLEDDGELTEPDHGRHGVLVYAARLDRPLVRALAAVDGAELLES
jgi:hypothetical protein